MDGDDLGQIPQLVASCDFAVNEQCAHYRECALLTPFIKANKPVFEIEYEVATTSFCTASKRLGLQPLRKKLELIAWLERCA